MRKSNSGIVLFVVIIILFIAISTAYSEIVVYSVSKRNGITIVLDAGHGGRDGGSVGVNGTIEKEINLKYAMTLKDKLVTAGYNVVMTRKNDDGLYDTFAKNKKVSDMNTRMQIIKKANPNLVISIHMNSFNDSSARGAMTYYRCDDESSKIVGDLIQRSLHAYCDARFEKSKVGDYFMVNCSYYTSVLIECGFISNPEEEKLLNTEVYRDKFTDAVFNGIMLYFGNNRVVSTKNT